MALNRITGGKACYHQLIWCDLSSPGVRIHTLGFPRPYRYDGREAQGEAATTVNHTDIRGLVAA